MNIIIMANGRGSRWSDKSFDFPAKYKQCIPINGIPMVARTINKVLKYEPENLYLIAPLVPEFLATYNLNELGKTKFHHQEMKEPVGSIIQGIMQLYKLWWNVFGERSIFLLGDVVFSNRALHAIMNYDFQNPTIFGRLSENQMTSKDARENFAFGIPSQRLEQERFFKSVLKIINSEIDISGYKLWNLFDQAEELGIDFYDFVGDYSDDIDSPNEYEQFYEKLNYLAVMDDKNDYR